MVPARALRKVPTQLQVLFGAPDNPTSQVVPYLNRLADLVYTLARWQEGRFRAVRTD